MYREVPYAIGLVVRLDGINTSFVEGLLGICEINYQYQISRRWFWGRWKLRFQVFWPNNWLWACLLSCDPPTVCHSCGQPSLLQKRLAIKDSGNTAKSTELSKEILILCLVLSRRLPSGTLKQHPRYLMLWANLALLFSSGWLGDLRIQCVLLWIPMEYVVSSVSCCFERLLSFSNQPLCVQTCLSKLG